jgi:pentatricopeptide repeat protein
MSVYSTVINGMNNRYEIKKALDIIDVMLSNKRKIMIYNTYVDWTSFYMI